MVITNDTVFFVSGCGHSGTTVLAAILDSHPSIYTIKRETTWFSNFGQNYNQIKQEYEFEKNKDETRFLKKHFIAEKTANHIFQIPLINKFFPKAKHILITRNPLNTCASLHQRYKNLDQSIDRWNNANYFVVQHSIDSNAFLIRYERLVSHPEQELSKLCNFINLPYDPQLLNFYQRDIHFDEHDSTYKKRNLQIKQPLTDFSQSLDIKLTTEQISYVKKRTEKISTILGYF